MYDNWQESILKRPKVFFWNGPFSQWYPSKFVLEGMTYNCAEQAMMAAKAALFDDNESLTKILDTNNPREQKKIGRLVKNFNSEDWNLVCRDFVYDANYAKFTQNPNLLDLLMNQPDDCLFVEASPYDKVWGIGLGEDNPDHKDVTKWRGTNWLGQVLTLVRDHVKIGFHAKNDEDFPW